MTFTLACGDVMPGCSARFEAGERDVLMRQVASHVASAHGIREITPEVAAAVNAAIVQH